MEKQTRYPQNQESVGQHVSSPLDLCGGGGGVSLIRAVVTKNSERQQTIS